MAKIPASNRIFSGLMMIEKELTSIRVGITVSTAYIVVANAVVVALPMPGKWLPPKLSLESLAKPLVQDLQ